jgi:tRNA(Ile)-lysidine synthase TilS/MesJ
MSDDDEDDVFEDIGGLINTMRARIAALEAENARMHWKLDECTTDRAQARRLYEEKCAELADLYTCATRDAALVKTLEAENARLNAELEFVTGKVTEWKPTIDAAADVFEGMKAELARLREASAKMCRWTEGSEGEWNTECGACWVFEDDPEGDNNYCAKCGNKIEFRKWEEPNDLDA